MKKNKILTGIVIAFFALQLIAEGMAAYMIFRLNRILSLDQI